MSDILAKLSAHFPPERISWRVGPTNKEKTKGIALGYIDARDVMQRLDEVCGALWGDTYTSMHNGSCCCALTIKIDGEWVTRSNGALNLSDSDKADAKEMAEKGSYSDAFKRAAVLWGIGRYLYDIDSPWVDIREQGRSYVLADSATPILTRLLTNMAKGSATPAPTNGADDPVEAARKWGRVGALTEIKGCKLKRDLDLWIAENAKKRVYLRKVDSDLADGIDHAISVKEQSFNVLVAG